MTKLKYFGNVGIVYAVNSLRKENPMMKTLEVMSETIRNTKHPFRKTEHLTKKPQKNRHERRKIKEFLHLGDWLSEEMA